MKISSKMPNCAEQGNGTKCVMTKDTNKKKKKKGKQ